MREFVLLKLIETTGNVDSRKRIHKTAFLLQLLGCPLKERFIWHYYGPYSPGLALLLEEMVARGFVDEETEMSPGGYRYRYRLTSDGQAAIHNFEASAEGKEILRRVQPALDQVARFARSDFALPALELASSILFWEERTRNLEEATDIVSKAKQVPAGTPLFEEARGVATEVLNMKHSLGGARKVT
jgi:uncharacterized protein YwgA